MYNPNINYTIDTLYNTNVAYNTYITYKRFWMQHKKN